MTTPDTTGRTIPTVEISLPGMPGFEKVARNAAATVAEQMGFSADRIEDLKTAVSEACMNAVQHGNNGDSTATIKVVMRAESARLSVLVNDGGKKPLPNLPPTAPQEPHRDHGWGLFFINELMDHVSFQRLPDGGNQMLMVVHLATAQPGIEHGGPYAVSGSH
jgi:serine/threonine-protein kinase RsbW